MARVSTYLNFPRTTEAAFLFYKSVFGTEFTAPIARFRDIPASPDQPPLAEGEGPRDARRVAHPRRARAHGDGCPGVHGIQRHAGQQRLHQSRTRHPRGTRRLVDALADGGSIETPLQVMFWGGYFASFVDRFGIRWMLNCASKS